LQIIFNEKEKTFNTLANCVNVAKLFSSLLMQRPNKLERLSLASFLEKWVRPQTAQVEHLSGYPFKGRQKLD